MNAMVANIQRHLSLFALATALLFSGGLVAGCGGGGGGGGGGGPTSTTGVSSGTIQGFGSVIVNGVRFNTDNATFVIEGDDNPSQSDLREGMIVLIDGSFDDNGTTGTATLVTRGDDLEGPVASITETTPGLVKVLSILGHNVIVENGVTVFDDTPPVTYANLAVDQVLEISGHMAANGDIQATFIEKKAETSAAFLADPLQEFEILGTVSNLGASTFNINNLIIDFSGVTPRNGSLANGALVEVKGRSFDAGTNTLTATDVELKAGLGANIAKVELEGLIANLNTGAQTFTINGQLVNYSAATFRGGLEADLANGTKVEAEGSVNAAGTLNAVKVTFKESVRIEGNVAAVNAASFTMEGLGGITIEVDSGLTRLDNLAALGNLASGNEIKVRARQAAGGRLVATRLELINTQPANRTFLQGPVANINNPSFTILGVSVNTSTVNEFEIEDTLTNRAGFFAALNDGDIVKARADLPGLVWDQVEIELEDNN
ncbi:hypothetical protein DESUT3_38150 [Desulfuromonas versatilis]|uniref:DUF5666 domain-containing protein n=1 Tax=Desulfuromonas versatilis TaxID=2802975 RepID=A0ABM8I065_9BACT|nr:DUF5666 domain-containing protein [Desulfuromonas versatilis]BCR06746.1 hypothetical protein DESUT3_38150 [Desulfuromonas versatilis]